MAEKYDKVDMIGSGTFGQAWLVLKHDTGRKYVLKEVQVVGLSEKSRKQALTEVKALSRCKHINVVRYKEAFVDKGLLCIVMEFADGGDLHHKIKMRKGKPFEPEVIIDWIVQICFALRNIHNMSIIHRDLKTQNIFLTSAGVIKLGDLGIARILTMDEKHANTAVGTPYYLSPEICRRKPYNYKTDMWAAGCVLYELCTFKHPFEGPCFSSLVLQITQGKYKPLPDYCGPILEDLVEVLMNVDPDQRPSAEQVLCIPSLQPFIKTYIRKTHAIKQRQVLSSPCVSTPDPAPEAPSSSTTQHHGTPTKKKLKPEDLQKRSMSTPRVCQDPDTNRRVQSAKSGAGNTPLKMKELVAASPKLSLYKEVLKKRKPLASLATPNSPQPVFRLQKHGSPVANRTRKRSHEDMTSFPSVGKEGQENISPIKVSTPRGRIQRVWSERSHVRNRVQDMIRQKEIQRARHTPTVSGQNNSGEDGNKPAKRRASIDIVPTTSGESSSTKPEKSLRTSVPAKSIQSGEEPLIRQVQNCLLRTCAPNSDVIYSDMEQLRHFLDDKLGSKKFHSMYSRLKEFGTERVHLDSFCAGDTASTCLPVLTQLIQLEHFAKLLDIS